MELVTMHTHTNYTGHGYGTVAELVDAAAAAKLGAIAVTEHYPMSAAMDPDNVVSMAWDRLPDYLIDIAAAAAAHPEMQVIPGCEIDWLGAQEDRDFSALDFSNFIHVLGSVHYLDGWAFDDPAQEARWHDVGVDSVWRRYFEVVPGRQLHRHALHVHGAPRSGEEVRLSSQLQPPAALR